MNTPDFINDNFILQSEIAKTLYQQYANLVMTVRTTLRTKLEKLESKQA